MQREKMRNHPATLETLERELRIGMWERISQALAANKMMAKDSAPKRKVLARAFKTYTSAKKASVAT